MTIDTQEYKKIIDDIKRKEYQRGYDEGIANKRASDYQKGYSDGVKDVFMTVRRAFSDDLNDIWDKEVGKSNG